MLFTNFNIFYKKNTIPAPNVEIEVFYSDTFNIETIHTTWQGSVDLPILHITGIPF